MLFNSLAFALFLPIVFFLYWFVANKSLRTQNILLLVASYYFYACWDWRFLFLLIFSTLLDYYTGLKMSAAKTDNNIKFWFVLSVGINLGFLMLFKYYDFFAVSFASFLSGFGFKVNVWVINVVLPIGISFYTFHGLSYVIDIYKKRISAERDYIEYALFVSFFPLLVAGPIERATHLLPQIKTKRKFEYGNAVDGLRQILFGLFKKMVIADNCAQYVNTVFVNPDAFSGSTHVVAAIFFAFQIYCDFSGYSDIALGVAKLFGIDLLKNFAFPYFSRDIAEFWRRWHISLSSWFRDYLYIPLGGSRVSTIKKIRNVIIVFLVSGFWHGANWTFIFWGTLNALFILPSVLFKTNRNNLEIVARGKLIPSFREVLAILQTFSLTVFAWVFFRSNTITQGFHFFAPIFSKSLFSIPSFLPLSLSKTFLLLMILFIIAEWIGRESDFALQQVRKINKYFRWSLYCLIIYCIITKSGQPQPFVYFQF